VAVTTPAVAPAVLAEQHAEPATPSPAELPGAEVHLSLLRELQHLGTAAPAPRARSRGRQPSPRQRVQQYIRQEAVSCYHWLQQQGQTQEQCAAQLDLSARTLRGWDHDLASLGLAPPGRPATRSALAVRQAILGYVKLTGPGIGVPSLQEHFPDVARAELVDLLERYRVVCRLRGGHYGRVLHWQTPGVVWAADFAEPSLYGLAGSLPPIAGCYPYVLAVRDLASGFMLAWQPLPALTEQVTRDALRLLFALHGAPLILKMDNGSAFRAAGFADFLETWGVIPLYSPPSCPMYNGAIEASIGSLKKRTEEQARARGRSGTWDVADLGAAQQAANASHPRRLNGRTPTSVWQARTPVGPIARVGFELTVERERFQFRDELGIDQEQVLDHWRRSAVDRRAIERALVEHGHLLFTRRRIPLMIRAAKAAADV
jgi:transposase InsO family protein